jgi:hypothetical protein
MKRFKLEKSRSTLWREARTVAEHQHERDDLDPVQDDAEFTETCYRRYEHAVNEQSSGTDTSEHEECQIPDGNVATVIPVVSDLSFECSIGKRWLVDDDSDSESDYNDSLVKSLAMWSVENHVTITATGTLLSILQPYLPFLPKSAQCLRNTLRDTSHLMKTINGGEYCHLGLSFGLTNLIKQNRATLDELELQINVDGIPLFKSTSQSLWPILCLVRNLPFKAPFVVGMFCGREKPGSASEFLIDFVTECCTLMKDGLTVDHETKKIKIHSFVCDAPARAFIKGIKSPTGYCSCEKCTVHGDYDRKVIFPVGNYPLRTDATFDAMTDEEHHIIPCPLKPLSIGYVTQFGLDYMHLACLGVMRRLILYWKGPDGPLHVRLGRKLICDLSSRLLQLSQFVPVEFARKPRSLDDVMRWKATEFREFLLYSGPLVLHNILVDDLYDHFMLLFVSMRILASQQLSQQYCDYADELLVKFVSDAQVLYGNDILVYNVHCLIHLANDVKNLGCLDDFSAFVFENKLGQLKKLVRKPQQPLQQIMRRLHEEASIDVCHNTAVPEPTLVSEHHNGPILHGFGGVHQFKRVQTNRFTLSVNTGNNCVLLDGCIPALVKNIVQTDKGIILVCMRFVSVQEAFLFPLPSSRLNIFRVSRCRDVFSASLSDVTHKCVCWPLFIHDSLNIEEESFLIFPLLH